MHTVPQRAGKVKRLDVWVRRNQTDLALPYIMPADMEEGDAAEKEETPQGVQNAQRRLAQVVNAAKKLFTGGGEDGTVSSARDPYRPPLSQENQSTQPSGPSSRASTDQKENHAQSSGSVIDSAETTTDSLKTHSSSNRKREQSRISRPDKEKRLDRSKPGADIDDLLDAQCLSLIHI